MTAKEYSNKKGLKVCLPTRWANEIETKKIEKISKMNMLKKNLSPYTNVLKKVARKGNRTNLHVLFGWTEPFSRTAEGDPLR